MDLGVYRAVRQLADGELGPTYLAVEKAGSQKAAVKTICPEFLHQPEALSRLSALATGLASPPAKGIVKLLSCTQQADGSVVLAMPFIDGANLAEIVARHPGEAANDSLKIARDVAAMLAAGHRAGLRHLGLKPSQVLVSVLKDGQPGIQVHLLGLGLVEALGRHRLVRRIGRRQVYVAPEQHEAATGSPVDAQTDVFGLAILMLHLLLGQQPSLDAVQKCRDDAASLLAGRVLRTDTARLLQAMLAASPQERPTLADVIQIFEKEIDAASLQATRESSLSNPDHAVERPKSTPAQPEGRLFGNFRIIRRLGEGGMGVVYEAEHTQIGRRAAIKVLHPECSENAAYAKRFLNEARAVNIIRHPGLVEIFEYGQQPDGTLYIVMEFLQGESLRARLDQRKDAPQIAQIVAWATQIARALTATHAKGIIHRDLKPENLMLVPDPVRTEQDWVKVLDFGIAKLSKRTTPSEENSSPAKTAAGSAMGTPLYMAPEQHSNADIVDGRADVFAFGILLYEMLAGRLPYEDNSLSLLVSPVAPLEKVNAATPKNLATLVRRMMSVRLRDRPAMAEVEAQLTALAKKYDRPRHSGLFLVAGGLLAMFLGSFGFIGYRLLRPLSLPEARGRALSLVQESLRSGEIEERLQATQALGKSRDIAYRPLLEGLLAEKKPPIVAAAARGLGDISAMEAQPALLALLDSADDVKVRMEAAAALARLSNPKGLEALRRLLLQGDDLTRLEAALRLLEYGDRTGTALLDKVTEREIPTTGRAVPVLAALARVGDARAKQRLTELFLSSASSRNEDPLVAFSLARLGDAAAHKQLTQLASKPGPAQIMAARLLSSLGESEGYSVLVKASEDDKQPERTREIALDGLGDSGHAEAASVMARTLAEPGASKRLRISAAGSILQLAAGEAGLLASRSLSWARAALGSDSSSTRELAVMLLGDLEAADSVAPLRQALKDEEREVRRGAARALGRKSVSAALDALADALDDSEGEVRAAGMQSIGLVLAALRKRGEPNAESVAVGRLRQMAQKGTDVDRVVAEGTLLHLGDTSQRSILGASLRSENPRVRQLAVDLMESDPLLLAEGLKDIDPLVQFAAARRLAALGSRAGVPVMQSTLKGGGLAGLTAYSLLKQLGEPAEPPPDWADLLLGRILRDKEAVLDVIAELPSALALKLIATAVRDPSSMVRRRAAEIAYGFYARTLQTEFRKLLVELRNDPDVIVRSRVAELIAKLPVSSAGATGDTAAAPRPMSPPAPTSPKADSAQPPSVDAATAAPTTEETHAPAPPEASPGDASAKNSPPSDASPPRADGADQLLRNAAEALQAKDYSRAQEMLSRVDRLEPRGLKSSRRPELYFLQGRLHETRQQWQEAMAAYMKYQKLPPAEQRGATAQGVKESIGRLAKKLGRIQIYVIKEGRCQLSNEYYLAPGEHIIGVGGGLSRTVLIDAGTTTPLRQCE